MFHKSKTVKEFFKGNPTLWEVSWAFLWRAWLLAIGVYASFIIVGFVFALFATGLASLAI